MFGALLLAALVVFGCGPAPSDPGGEGASSELERLVPELMAQARVPGLQIALIRDGEMVLERGFGVTGGPDGAAVDADTVFEAASLTKPLFAYVVMTLVDEGVVELDRPILEYLPQEQVEEALGHDLDAEGFRRDWFETITARQVLSHSAGLPHGDGGAVTTVFFEPGSDWKYSAEAEEVEWLTGYMRALERPVPIDASRLELMVGDYGPRHFRARDGRLYYSRDTVDEETQRELFAESEDTFVLDGVTSFKLRVVFGDDGVPTELVRLYEGGRRDVTPRDG